MLTRSQKAYVILTSIFVTVLVLTNIIGSKLFILSPDTFLGITLVFTSGIITYPFTFWLTDIVSEIWGKRHANLMVWIGFFASILMLGLVYIAKILPPAEAWQIPGHYAQFYNPAFYLKDDSGEITGIASQASQAAFTFIFDAPGILLFSSMLAYLIAQLLDIRLFHFWKNLTKGKYLWLRNNGSTMISQLVDTFIVNSIFLSFYFGLPFFPSETSSVAIIQIILANYFLKLIFALLDTPMIYLGVYSIKKYLATENTVKTN